MMRLTGFVFLAALCLGQSLYALEHVTIRRDSKEQTVSGQLVVTAEDGGVLVMGADGTLWAIEPAEIVTRKDDDEPFQPLTRDELSQQLLAELPAGFEIHSTHHYLIC